MALNFSKSQSSLTLHSNAMKSTFVEHFRAMFYGYTPSQTFYKDVSSVPSYGSGAVFITFVAMDVAASVWKGSRKPRMKDGLTNLHSTFVARLVKMLGVKTYDLSIYFYVYDNWRLADFPWNSHIAWILSFFLVDLAYYWFHRASHEINILWMSHQTHHSSEDFNMTTAFRRSAFRGVTNKFFYAPCGLLIPPSIHLVHMQLNILTQIWTHTEHVHSLGPLDYILVTASHHRVHHGRNPYCIDKNYGGVLIIWDRIFGTFAAERKDEKIAYGLVTPLASFDPTYLQLGYFRYMCARVWSTEGLWNKLCVVFKGPGWAPGKPRLGEFEDLPQIEHPINRYDKGTPKWVSAYGFIHTLALMPMYRQLMRTYLQLTGEFILLDVIFILTCFTCLGFLFDKKPYAYFAEFLRCILAVIFLHLNMATLIKSHNLSIIVLQGIALLYLSSIVWWLMVLAMGKKKDKGD